jgi:hypothetical protein
MEWADAQARIGHLVQNVNVQPLAHCNPEVYQRGHHFLNRACSSPQHVRTALNCSGDVVTGDAFWWANMFTSNGHYDFVDWFHSHGHRWMLCIRMDGRIEPQITR